jgi:hypothetical protein
MTIERSPRAPQSLDMGDRDENGRPGVAMSIHG